MPTTQLTPELISLVHHVELNKTGWMDETIRQLILTKLATVDDAVNLDGVVALLSDETSREIGRDRIGKQIDKLLKSYDITSPSEGSFKVSEVNRKRYRDAIKTAEGLDDRVKAVFETVFKDLPVEIDRNDLWKNFTSGYLNPLLAQLGATTFKLFTGDGSSVELPRFDVFLMPYAPSLHEQLHNSVENFLRSGDEDVRAFILGSLNAFYFIEAASLNEDTIETLRKNPGEQVEFVIYTDTNFLLTLLGFKNSLDEAADTINEFVAKLSGRVKVKFHILPSTLKESQNVLARKRDKLGRLHLTSRQYSGLHLDDFDEIDLRFIDQHRQTGITADAYFSPYIDDLIICLSDRGLVFDNADISKYPTRQDVVDDILFVQEAEKEHKVEVPKSYEQLEHDMILWHFVNDRRPNYVQSPAQAKYWILTFDSRLRAFDSQKKHTKAVDVQICLHPATFIQMLQFWVPRTPEFEAAILSSLRIPFLAQDFDSKAEHVTLEILGALSRFEQVGDIKVETINELLTSSALRDKISAKRDRDATFKLVREALIEKHALTEKELERTRKEKEQFESQAAKEKTELQAALDAQAVVVGNTTAELTAAQEKIRQLEDEKATSKTRWKFVRRWIIFPLLLIAVITALLALLLPATVIYGKWLWVGAAFAVLLLAHVWLLEAFADENESVKSSRAFRLLKKSKVLLTLIIVIIWSVVTFVFGDQVKTFLKLDSGTNTNKSTEVSTPSSTPQP